MKEPIHRSHLDSEALLLYTLLDAADSAGLIKDAAIARRWQESKINLTALGYEAAAQAHFDLLTELERVGALKDTWIALRWDEVRARVHGGC